MTSAALRRHQADLKLVLRDPLLRWTAVLGIGAFLPLLRFGVPWLAAYLEQTNGFDLRPYFPLIQSTCVMIAPLMAGMVMGLGVSDQRDDGTLIAISVSPPGVGGYLLQRLLPPTVVGFLTTVVMLYGVALVPMKLLDIVLLSAAAAPLAPLFGLTIGVLARNKMQAFAVAKANGVVTVPVIVAWFIDPPAQLLMSALPTYPPVKLTWLAMDGSTTWWPWLLPAVLWQLLLIRWLARRLTVRAGV
ncbi:MAG: hypothetical protein AAGA23_08425 [Pseudomonadota bacterium]